jgi:hypothetical protein
MDNHAGMSLNRRQFLVTAAASGAFLVARPLGALAQPLDPGLSATSRVSRLFPAMRLVHGDLHNHTVRSDGSGDPALAFASMRAAGLDFAALTDHASVSKAAGPAGMCVGASCAGLGINENSWAEAGVLADGANVDGSFAAIRGFEWSSPQLGHINVWFGQTWVDPLSTAGVDTTGGTAQFVHDGGLPLTDEQAQALDQILKSSPTSEVGIAGFQQWLKQDPGTPVIGGGSDALAGFNHPGREPGRYGQFRFDPALQERMVSLEIFNRGEDYLFEGIDSNPGIESPLQQCLQAGWRPGLAGVTDEHGTKWGTPENNGRTGIYVSSLSRDGVRAGMESRHFFASRLRGLRIDASANGVPMGGQVPHESGAMTFALDIDRGAAWYGRRINVQVLQAGRAGEQLPRVVRDLTVTVPTPDEPVISFDVPISSTDGGWIVLRLSDPASTDLSPGAGNKKIEEDGRARGTAFEGRGPAIAYTSPFFLTAAAPVPVVPEASAAVLLPVAAALGMGAAYVHQRRSHSHSHSHSHSDGEHGHGEAGHSHGLPA